ncbi:precorrin-2 C(20)-methyltransferase [bacterium]|nr:precorrin-2 C(20)-methyltransferase [bacterium]
MIRGTLYGIGVGPGDPELLTLKGASLLAQCRHVFVPKARKKAESVALAIAGKHLPRNADVQQLVFPMTTDKETLARRWDESAAQVDAVLAAGEDACFLTLGDPMLYSTYIYLLRALLRRAPDAQVVTVPGITSFSAAAALTAFPIGEAKEPITVVPTADDLTDVRRALAVGGTVVLMKIGARLPAIIDALEEANALDDAVLVARAGQPGQRIETDLRALRDDAEVGYLSIILVHPAKAADL